MYLIKKQAANEKLHLKHQFRLQVFMWSINSAILEYFLEKSAEIFSDFSLLVLLNLLEKFAICQKAWPIGLIYNVLSKYHGGPTKHMQYCNVHIAN